MSRLLVAGAAGPAASRLAQQPMQQQTAAPAPRDTTPPAAYFGVTEYQLARQKLEQDMQRGGFSVYIIARHGGAGRARCGT